MVRGYIGGIESGYGGLRVSLYPCLYQILGYDPVDTHFFQQSLRFTPILFLKVPQAKHSEKRQAFENLIPG